MTTPPIEVLADERYGVRVVVQPVHKPLDQLVHDDLADDPDFLTEMLTAAENPQVATWEMSADNCQVAITDTRVTITNPHNGQTTHLDRAEFASVLRRVAERLDIDVPSPGAGSQA
ncbi:hypothetical protein GCM10022247_35370 [Allokutzneria multivorans]|uniref:Uncharacterized protein n=1 Tax=Allokutzneria multivorans TaxID=1142134 RepID=A0ABP7SDN4_9PSEU